MLFFFDAGMWDVVGEVNGQDVIYLYNHMHCSSSSRRGNYGDGEILINNTNKNVMIILMGVM